MPRVRHSRNNVTTINLAPPRVTRLRSTPNTTHGDTSIPMTPDPLLKNTVTPVKPKDDLNRTRYGRALNLDRIEQALRSADYGSMRCITDLSRETIDTDPHLAAVLDKRFGAISALPVTIVPATGVGLDPDRARYYADVVRDQIKQLPNFSQKIHQLAWALFDGRSALENEWLMPPQVPGLPEVANPKYGRVTWMIRDLTWIHPRRLQFGPQRELRIVDNYDGGNFAEVGIAMRDLPGKFIQFTPQLFGDYQEREGLARRCLYWSFFKRTAARERMILMELFGKPWRWLEVAEDSTAGPEDLLRADELMQQMGGLASFRTPRGTQLKVEQPGKGAGEVHQEVVEESDKQISKLVLGQTGTTDANPAGLNNAQANVMQDEQFAILMRDAKLVSEAIETYLTDAIIQLNFGASALPHAPHFVLRADVPLDRGKEIARLDSAVKAGLEVSLSEAYEISGFKRPEDNEAVIKLETPPLHPMAVQPPPERPVIVHPEGEDLPSRQLQPIAPVGDGGLDQPTGGAGSLVQAPGGNNEPADDTGVTDAEGGVLSEELNAALARMHPSDAIVVRNMLRGPKPCSGDHALLEQQPATVHGPSDELEEEVLTAPQPVDREELGGIETVITRGITEGARASTGMTRTFVKAVEGMEDARMIVRALDRAAEDQNLHPMSRSMERRLMQGAMTGAVASHVEIYQDFELPSIDIEPTSEGVNASRPFTDKPFAEAVRWFKSLDVLSRTAFDQLDAAARRRAFTIANIHNVRQLEIAKLELSRQLEKGASLADFSTKLEERFTAAGMTTMNPSHVETVYRTNVVNSYNSGRHTQMTQPEVKRTHSFWQIRTVNDGPPRQRDTHRAVHNWVLKADDPFWQTAYPPFGFNCRCRVSPVSNVEVANRGLRVRTGGEVRSLPDPGFTSGTSGLL